MALTGVKTTCSDTCGVDDSGWDYNPTDETGRMVFEVDNSCIPDNTTQRVRTNWTYAASADVDEDVPIVNKFTVQGNYTNPVSYTHLTLPTSDLV